MAVPPAARTKVFTMGENESLQLGLADRVRRSIPTRVLGIEGEVVSVACRFSGVELVTDDGSVWSWGASEKSTGPHYDDCNENYAPLPRRIPFKVKIKKVACGSHHSMAITDAGALYTWGNGLRGQLGHGQFCNFRRPKLVETNLADVEVDFGAGGFYHSVVVCKQGNVWACGSNYYGACGFAEPDDFPAFQMVPREHFQGNAVTSIGGGFYHTIAVAGGATYTWGRSENGVLGYEKGLRENVYAPTAVPALAATPVRCVSAGGMHCVALASSGDIYTWGRNGPKMELGHGDVKEREVPCRVPLDRKDFVAVAGGGYGIYARTASGILYSFGEGPMAGLGSMKKHPGPAKVTALKGQKVVSMAGGGHFAVLVAVPDVWSIELHSIFPPPVRGVVVQCLALASLERTAEVSQLGRLPRELLFLIFQHVAAEND